MPESWTIGHAHPEDAPGLAELMAGSPLLRRYGTSRESALVSLALAQRKDDLLLVLRTAAGQPIGLAWVIGSRMLTRSAYLRLLLVAEGRRNTGLGTSLLAAAEASAREWANHMFLLVTSDNVGARRFYERCGYRHVGDLPEHAKAGTDEALYHKTLRIHGERLPA